MVKLSTPVSSEQLKIKLSLGDSIFILGNCFIDPFANRLADAGFSVECNPFGTIYNPLSIRKAVERLDSAKPYTQEDCVEMGAGAGLICSFEHHTLSARKTVQEFLEDANSELARAAELWKSATRVILSIGTSCVWERGSMVVANCLKRPGYEFTRRMLSIDEVRNALSGVIKAHPEKQFLIIASPIRCLGDGAHADNLDKSTMLLGIESALGENACYFPAYEIMRDELRDYRFYDRDLNHPNDTAIEILWERLMESVGLPNEAALIRDNEKKSRQAAHKTMLGR